MNRPETPRQQSRRMITQHPAYIRARAVFGILFIVLGAFIVVQIVHGVGLRVESIPGVLLGAAMIALGYVRIRAAFDAGKPPAG